LDQSIFFFFEADIKTQFLASSWEYYGSGQPQSHFPYIVYSLRYSNIMSDGAGKRKQGPGGNGPAFKKSKVREQNTSHCSQLKFGPV
jgi:hypothetical protein